MYMPTSNHPSLIQFHC